MSKTLGVTFDKFKYSDNSPKELIITFENTNLDVNMIQSKIEGAKPEIESEILKYNMIQNLNDGLTIEFEIKSEYDYESQSKILDNDYVSNYSIPLKDDISCRDFKPCVITEPECWKYKLKNIYSQLVQTGDPTTGKTYQVNMKFPHGDNYENIFKSIKCNEGR